MYASVVMEKTGTPTLTFTAAVPAKPPPTAIEVSDSLEVASTVASPLSVASTVPASHASVSLRHDLDVDAGADAGGAADRDRAGDAEDRRSCPSPRRARPALGRVADDDAAVDVRLRAVRHHVDDDRAGDADRVAAGAADRDVDPVHGLRRRDAERRCRRRRRRARSGGRPRRRCRCGRARRPTRRRPRCRRRWRRCRTRASGRPSRTRSRRPCRRRGRPRRRR